MTDVDPQTLIGFFGTLLGMALWGALHSLLASRTAKRRIKNAWGEPANRLYRLSYNAVAVITFVPVLAVPALFPGRSLYQIPPPGLWLTLALQGLAAMTVLVGLLQTDLSGFLGLSQLFGQEAEPEELVTEGLYRWVRHPLYTAGLVLVWLMPRMTTSLLALNLGISAYLYIGSIFEENKLVAEFGQQYERYRREVPRLIPRPWKGYRHDA